MTYSNSLEKIETIRDDRLIKWIDPTVVALTGRMDMRFADTTPIDLAASGTPVDLGFGVAPAAEAGVVQALPSDVYSRSHIRHTPADFLWPKPSC